MTLTTSAAGNVTLANSQDLSLGNITVSNGTLAIKDAGNITQAANTAATVSGNASFNATNGAINLSYSNTFNGQRRRQPVQQRR